MRPIDKIVFSEAAHHFNVWLLVRRTNPKSLPYIGKSGYVAKRIDCKAKTADLDSDGFQTAGLVVDASIHPHAFKSGKGAKALGEWDSFARQQGISEKNEGRYTVDRDKKSRHYGCVLFDGKYIHGDYDLYDIILAEQPRRNLAAVEVLHGVPHMRGAKLHEVMAYINERIGAEVVRHGGEMQYADHSEQSIDAFGPKGEACTILNRFSIEAWYKDRFQGRRPITMASR